MDTQLVITFLKQQGIIGDDQEEELIDEQSRSGKPIEQIVEDFATQFVSQTDAIVVTLDND